MRETLATRNYSLTGSESKLALEKGLADAQWYTCPLSRSELKELTKRKDAPAIRDTLLWLGGLALAGALGYTFWGTWWAVPSFLVYGVLYGSASDSRWHETMHGTAFRSRWLNEVVNHIAGFMDLREPTVARWSHARHHSDTIIVGRDPEIDLTRPPDLVGLLLNVFALKSGCLALRKLCIHAAHRLTAEEETFVPESERWKICLLARIHLAIFAAVVAACIGLHSILPAMYVGLPSFYGCFLVVYLALTQHAGLAEDVLDHRLNTRTVYMNPVSRFVYWNMNYHLEHHLFPLVPYHALPRLHAVIKAHTPRPYRSTIEAYCEIVPTLLRQLQDPGYCARRELPAAEAAPAGPGTRLVAH